MDEFGELDNVDGEVEIIELGDTDAIDLSDEEDIEYLPEFESGIEEEAVEVIDISKRTFAKHTKSVFQGILNAAGTLAATGGEDEIAYIWSTESCEVLLECTGHQDSVTHLVFSFDEQFLATGDMGGLIQVWSITDKKLVWCYEGDELEWLLWHTKANVLFAGVAGGTVFVWQIPGENCKVLSSRGSASTCGYMLSDGLRLLVGYANGQVRLWDIKAGSVIWELQHNLPINGVTSMDVTKDDSLFMVAPSAQVFKVTDGSFVTTLLSTNEVDVETVAFNNESGLIATGALSGTACIWDIKTNSIRHEANLGASITIMKWGPNDTLIFGSGNANVYVVNAKSGELIQTLTGHKLDILSLSLSNECNVLLSTSDDGTAKIFTIT